MRADALLLEREMVPDLATARNLMLAGKVRIGNDHVIKNGAEMLSEDADINVVQDSPYVSRGAYKLKPALDKHLPLLQGAIAMDVGASTGGFTDLMLQNGAATVYTVDSGRGQLHAKLRNDPRVKCHEQTNARTLPDDFITGQVDLLTMDVSFISVTAILPSVNRFLRPGGYAFILVKPQFEAEREEVGQGGVVRDETVRQKCIDKVTSAAVNRLQWQLLETKPCEIKGPKGNQEYMCVFQKPQNQL